MRTFIIRARKGSTRGEKLRAMVGSKEHFEVVLHTIMNAFFISSGFRTDVELYIVLDSSEDFPRTLKLSSAEGLSLPGFHETAIVEVIEQALLKSEGLSKDGSKTVAPGIEVYGFGFDKLVAQLLQTRAVYLLQPKGDDIRSIDFYDAPVFILSDHLAMPSKSIKGLERKGLNTLSLGKKMLFASQCVTLIHHELDNNHAAL